MVDLAIVGAGPAGMSAALTASRRGLSVLVVDEQQRPGGQIFRQPPAAWAAPVRTPVGYRWGRPMIEECEESAAISWRLGHTALGVTAAPDRAGSMTLLMRGPDGVDGVPVKRLLIATGAMDLPVAFPGWTLPGVYTAGGIQTMVKAQGLLPARTMVLAGAHPLLILVAELLLEKQAHIAEVVLAQRSLRPSSLLSHLGAVPGHLGVLMHGGSAFGRLLRSRTPIRRGAIVTAARGDGRVEEVDVADVGPDWQPLGPTRAISADGLVIGYGFQPSTELARQVGCRLQWNSPKGGWVVSHDDHFATSVPGVYVAGEPAGVGGAEQSRAEGHLAALNIVADLGAGSPPSRGDLARARADHRRASRFAAMVQEAFEPNRQALLALAKPSTPVCRCEGIERHTVEQVIEATPFLTRANALKLECRTGMGPCQGRYCELTASGLLAAARESTMEDVGHFTGQFPVRPVSVSDIATARIR
ncbi:MAG TPA: FAD-dependent oxidoreductase [Nocardioides sp.]|uniref:FAD-dependent oxidoreductase n=1 Tax=Nocardioides sp. TaxID=35761 RepID=UPI002BD792C2|nr:FAD-dependent oxidoreductase [Nocardioides sp.]HQR25522.1 FAD-dependent oxidoreductase [Nocardioides sp.]